MTDAKQTLKNGEIIHYYTAHTAKWVTYKTPQPNGKTGRWKEVNEYGGTDAVLHFDPIECQLADHDEITRLRQLAEQRDELLAAVRLTIAENGNLADGDDCTLRHLVAAIARAEGGAS